MPLYTIATRKPLPEDTRFGIAQVITDMHCGVAGAPAEFVNVIYMIGYCMKRGGVLGLNDNIRTGGNRDAGFYQRLSDGMHTHVAAAAGLTLSEVLVTLIGVEYNWLVKGGMEMPAPGEKDGWLEKKAAYHASLGIGPAA